MLTTKRNVCETERIIVIKIGGSVLVDERSYRPAAQFLAQRLQNSPTQRLVAVVSAQNGHTDELEAVAQTVTSYPNPRTLDLLWYTGELRSVALLALHLEHLGVAAVGLNAHEAGLCLNSPGFGDAAVETLCCEVRRAFHDHWIVVVPGFFATLSSGTVVSLGRGGSDLSAVLVARELEAEQCELIKDVPGYFTHDPKVHLRAEHIAQLSYDQALVMADDGCDLVQKRALETARSAGLRLVVRTLQDGEPASIVSDDGDRPDRGAISHEDKPV